MRVRFRSDAEVPDIASLIQATLLHYKLRPRLRGDERG
jgi:hypothetical protein